MNFYEKSSSPAFYITLPRYERGSLAMSVELYKENRAN